MRRALMQYYINGVDIVVDKEQVEGPPPENLAQERQAGLQPFIQAFGPIDRFDWAIDSAMRYEWVRFGLGEVPAVDEVTGLTGQHRYLTLTRSEWRLYTTEDNNPTTVVTGPTALGVVPVVPFYFKESSRRDFLGIPLSLLTRIAPVARYLLNLVSQTQVDIYRSIAFLVATGVTAEEIPTEITPMSCWALPNSDTTLSQVSGDVAHITAKLEFAQMLMEVILRIGKLTGGTGDLQSRAASGVQVAVERTDLDNEMRMTAVQAEQVERDVVRLAISRNLGTLVDEDTGFNVEYNKKFVLASVPELGQQMRDFVSMDIGDQVPSVNRVMLRKILDALISKDAAEYDEAIKEIEAADFAMSAPPEEDGGGEAAPPIVLAAAGGTD